MVDSNISGEAENNEEEVHSNINGEAENNEEWENGEAQNSEQRENSNRESHEGARENMETGGDEVEDIDVATLTPAEFRCLRFDQPETAYQLYNQYARVNGFGVRRGKFGRNRKKNILWVQFVCSREGERDEKYINMENRKRKHRPLTRCGCGAELRIHVDCSTQVWYVVSFSDLHNHPLVGEKLSGHIRSHRKMSDADIAQINSMRLSGISILKIFGSFAVQSGGENVPFGKKRVYNEIEKLRRMQGSDFEEALSFLGELQSIDPILFWKHYVSDDGCDLHLFWSDGTCQTDYELFGDVLAFDATYGRNKYKCPTVVFTGVNHHNQTCVFGCAIVSNERQETYVWLLEQFLQAMKGKRPKSVITDGDMAMRNAISIVFPETQHRLCVWHLLRNATANVHKPYFTKQLKKCMLGDLEVYEFEEKWKALVEECGLQDNVWVQKLYEKKTMWSAAHMRGKFFAGLRTTSRCEGLHAVVGKYVLKGYNFIESIQHFQRALENLRSNELDEDFKSSYGEPVLTTEFHSLERFASQVFTLSIFEKIRSLIVKSAAIKLVDTKETMSGKIYVVSKYRTPEMRWIVSFYSVENVFKCACRRMESLGISCVHIMKIIIELDMDELPRCLVLDRWTKGVKDRIYSNVGDTRSGVDRSTAMIRYGGMVHSCREMCKLACFDIEEYFNVRDLVENERKRLKKKMLGRQTEESNCSNTNNKSGGVVRPRVEVGSCSGVKKRKKATKCSICRVQGHNMSTCPFKSHLERHLGDSGVGNGSDPETEDDSIDLGDDE